MRRFGWILAFALTATTYVVTNKSLSAVLAQQQTTTQSATPPPATQQPATDTSAKERPAPVPAPQPTILSNDNHYTNSDGTVVHAPAKSSNGVPQGATAQCGDGSYSFSQHRQGTCSHHGGVSLWL